MKAIVLLLFLVTGLMGCTITPMNYGYGYSTVRQEPFRYLDVPEAETLEEDNVLRFTEREARQRADERILQQKKSQARLSAECNRYLDRGETGLYQKYCQQETRLPQPQVIIQQQMVPGYGYYPYYYYPYYYPHSYRSYYRRWGGGYYWRW